VFLGIEKETIQKCYILGTPAYGMLPMDPMHIDEIGIDDQTSQKQVALNLVMKNVDLLGLKHVKVNKIT